MNSGSTTIPPSKLNPASAGSENVQRKARDARSRPLSARRSARPPSRPTGMMRPVVSRTARARIASQIDATTPASERRSDKPEPRLRLGPRQIEPAIVQEHRVEKTPTLPRPRQRAQHREIPKENLQQERDVAQRSRHRRGPAARSANSSTTARCRRRNPAPSRTTMPIEATSSVFNTPTSSTRP